MTPTQKALFTEYAELKSTIKELEAKCEELKPQLVTLIPPDATIDTGTGTFTLSTRKVWKYSQNCKRLEDELKEVKKTEEQLGIAEAVEGEPFIIYKEKKA